MSDISMTFKNGDKYNIKDGAKFEFFVKNDINVTSLSCCIKNDSNGELSQLALFLKLTNSIHANIDDNHECEITINNTLMHITAIKSTYSLYNEDNIKEENVEITLCCQVVNE